MPTIKPRVQVTLDFQTHEVIQRLAAAQGRTRGAIIAELLDSVAPVLARTAAMIEAASEASEQVKSGLRSVAEGVHSDLVGAAGEGIRQMDLMICELSADSTEEANPRVVTRGSGIRHNTNPSATKKTRKGSISGLSGCTCTITNHERQENPKCPVHPIGKGAFRG